MNTKSLPAPHAATSCAPASPIEVATVLENTADQLLIHGRWRTDLEGPDGQMCVMRGIAEGTRPFDNQRVHWLLYDATRDVLSEHLGTDIVTWNLGVDDDDEVRDTLLLVAKELRNTAVPV